MTTEEVVKVPGKPAFIKQHGRTYGRYSTYSAPSITERINAAESIEALAIHRAAIMLGIAHGKLEPSPKTLAVWEQAVWERVARLLAGAETGERLCFIYNTILPWKRPGDVEPLIEYIFRLRAKELPSPRERLEANGVAIEGVTVVP